MYESWLNAMAAHRVLTRFPEIILPRPDRTSASVSRGRGIIGIDYIPNMNAGLRILVPFEDDTKSSAAAQIIATVPDRFDWNDEQLVRQYRMKDYQVQWLMRPPNQASCGSCWAVSSTSVLTDRHSIAAKRTIPILSAVTTASCAAQPAGHDGCQGGFPADAGCFFEQVGCPADACWPYASFCSPDGADVCDTTQEPFACCGQTNSTRSSVSNPQGSSRVTCSQGTKGCCRYQDLMNSCDSGTGSKQCFPGADPSLSKPLYKAIPGSTVSLAGGTLSQIQERVKREIFAAGPVVAGFSVYEDFMIPSAIKEWGWKATGGVYIHQDPSPYIHDPFVEQVHREGNAGKWASIFNKSLGADVSASLDTFKSQINKKLQSVAGAHAVVITGWDVAKNVSTFGTVPYWIVRNSWAEVWPVGPTVAKPGYFGFAFTDPSRNINVSTSMERQVHKNEIWGGCTSFRVADDVHAISASASGSLPSWAAKYQWPLFILLAMVLAMVVMAVVKKRQQAKLGRGM